MKFKYTPNGRRYIVFDEDNNEELIYNDLARELHDVLDSGEEYIIKNRFKTFVYTRVGNRIYKIIIQPAYLSTPFIETLYGNHALMNSFINNSDIIDNILDYSKQRNIDNIMKNL